MAGIYQGAWTGPEIDAAIGRASRISNPNLLDNWCFVGGGSNNAEGALPINQRGQNSYTGGGNSYTIDRWSIREVNNSLTVASDGVTAAKGSSAQKCDFYQMLPQGLINSLIGKTLTASVLYDGGIVIGTFVYDTSASLVAADSNIIVYSGGSYPTYTNFCIRVANSQKIYAAKLEIGNQQTLAHYENGLLVLNEIPNYAEELAKCQRYYVRYSSTSSATGIAVLETETSTGAMGIISLPVAMRQVSPTVTLSAGDVWQGSSNKGSPTISNSAICGNVLILVITVSGLTAPSSARLVLSANSYLEISCEL